jgi:hypothetical protein
MILTPENTPITVSGRVENENNRLTVDDIINEGDDNGSDNEKVKIEEARK